VVTSATTTTAHAVVDAAMLTRMYTTMERIRAFETVLSAQGERYGQIFVMTSGMEAIATGTCAVLNDDDFLLSTHRTQAHGIAKGLRMDLMLAEIMYKGTGYCGGRGGRQHMASLELGFIGGTGIVGANVPIACGVGLTCKMEKKGRVAACILGDGATTTGAFHEGLGVAALWDLPVVYVIENNQYAGYMPLSGQTKLERLSDRAKGYGIPGVTVDGTDVVAVAEAVAAAAERARAGRGPTLIEAVTLVLGGGTITNEGRKWRSDAEMAEWMAKDPIQRLRTRLIGDRTLDAPAADRIAADAKKEAEAAATFMHESPEPDPAEALRNIYYEGPRRG
jgi:TPP-dependent pyruvate/acetoin dehydrogenase alpha subunit